MFLYEIILSVINNFEIYLLKFYYYLHNRLISLIYERFGKPLLMNFLDNSVISLVCFRYLIIRVYPYSPYWYGYQQPYYPNMYQQPYSSIDVCGIPGSGQYGKPAIYLYPQEDTYISVDLAIDGQLTQTIPSYDDGWYVLANPDGDIFDRRDGYIQDKPYDYLFWEAETDLSKLELSDQGWVVAKGDLEGWFSANLPLLGLNEKEKAQFMEYWLERLSKSAYYELKLLSSEFLAEHATLIITPQPDTLIRVIFFFNPLNEPKTIESPVIETPEREGFVVLEWGGILAE